MLRLLKNRIAVVNDDTSVSEGGIQLLDSVEPNIAVGVVHCVGPGIVDDDGNLKPTNVSIGNKIKYLTNNVQQATIDGLDLHITTDDAVLAIIPN